MTIQIFRGTGRMAIMGMVAFMLAGCATIRNGGAPASLSISSADIVASDKHLFENGVLSKLLSASATIADRNVFINARLLAINMNYNVFASSLGVERQNADAVTQVAQIALGVAGVATAATRTKTNLAAATAALAGIKAIVDKEYYFDKSVPALTAMMSAQRLAVLQKIKLSMNDTVEQYDVRAVMEDLNAYQRAGTLLGAIAAVETLANALEETNSGEVRRLVAYTEAQVVMKRSLNVSLASLRVPVDVAAARIQLDIVGKVFGVVPDPKLAYDKAFAQVWDAFRAAPPEKLPALKAALKDQKLLIE